MPAKQESEIEQLDESIDRPYDADTLSVVLAG